MFKHLLVPTDGSPACEAGIQKSVEFAQSINARITGLHVIPVFHAFTHQTGMLEETREQFDRENRAHAAHFLAFIERAAMAAGVDCDTLAVMDDQPHEAIARIADDKDCDLIAMASHGRKGVKGFLLGSQTQKVLAHASRPVLVFH